MNLFTVIKVCGHDICVEGGARDGWVALRGDYLWRLNMHKRLHRKFMKEEQL